MLRLFTIASLAMFTFAAEPLYQIDGRIEPGEPASVLFSAVSSPFSADAMADPGGKFALKKIPAGSYGVVIVMAGRGEARLTVDVGPSLADRRRRIKMVFALKDSDFKLSDSSLGRYSVSARQLTVPDAALREYADAQKDLAKPDVASAIGRLEKAVRLAPQFAIAWNYLGTVFYKTRDFPRAEECFRKALEAEPRDYMPLVNLGGVLINLRKLDEALAYNLRAVQARPDDALSNTQLGMTYFYLRQPDLAATYLEKAALIDPGHFSHPQLFLAEIQAGRGESEQAAQALEAFLKLHPDYPAAAKVRESIAKLRN